jgi:hypothetical protein
MNKRNETPASSNRQGGPAFTKPPPGSLQNDSDVAKWVRNTVRTMDGGGRSEPDLLDVACFLVAASIVGADEQRIAEILSLKPERVAAWAENLRRNGLWLGDGRVLDAHWFDTGGEIGFLLDTLVAQGYIQRLIDPVKGPVYHTVAGRHPLEGN